MENIQTVKVLCAELEDVKRIRMVNVTPTANGLTIIGGRNNQGKTSVINSLMWGLGGDKYRPSNPTREGSLVPPKIKIKLDNGIVVERSGKNSELKVTDPSGRKSGQKLLNSFISSFALDIPKFMEMNSKEKADVLLQIIGVGDKLAKLDNEESILYNRRLEIGRIAEQKAKYASELPEYEGIPNEPVSPSELIRQQQEILARNGENQRKRSHLADMKKEYEQLVSAIEETERRLSELNGKREKLGEDIRIASVSVQDLVDESTAELENNIRNIEALNIKIRSNLEKEKAEEEARHFSEEYNGMTAKIEQLRSDRRALLDNADLPLKELSVQDGELIYKGAKWDCMSGSEQLKVAVSIVRKLNPNCGFVLIDKLEQMDLETLHEFGKWLETEGLQAIATRVSTGDECSIIIEDGYVKENKENNDSGEVKTPSFKKGCF